MTQARPPMSGWPSRQVPVLISIVAVLLAAAASAHAESAPAVTLTIIEAPETIPASAGFALRVRVVNTGTVPVRACVLETGRVLTEQPCIVLGYRFLNPPRHLDVDSVDTGQLLPFEQILQPGESHERHVWLYATPRQSRSGGLHLYVISSAGGRLTWAHRSLPITVTGPSWEVRRRELATWTILGVYLLGIAWAIASILRRLRPRRTPCSS